MQSDNNNYSNHIYITKDTMLLHTSSSHVLYVAITGSHYKSIAGPVIVAITTLLPLVDSPSCVGVGQTDVQTNK